MTDWTQYTKSKRKIVRKLPSFYGETYLLEEMWVTSELRREDSIEVDVSGHDHEDLN
jgi:hypothetical protein